MSNEVPPPDNGKIPPWAKDAEAVAEDKKWGDEGALKGQRDKNDLLWLKTYGRVVVVLLIFFALLFLSSIASWSAHYLLPESWHWLSSEQLSKIQSVLFSGSIGGVLTLVANRQLSK